MQVFQVTIIDQKTAMIENLKRTWKKSHLYLNHPRTCTVGQKKNLEKVAKFFPY